MTIIEKIAQIEPIIHPGLAASPVPSSPTPIGNERIIAEDVAPNHGWIRWAQSKMDNTSPENK